MAAAPDGDQPDPSFRDHRSRDAVEGKRAHGPVAKLRGTARVHHHLVLAQHVALQKTTGVTNEFFTACQPGKERFDQMRRSTELTLRISAMRVICLLTFLMAMPQASAQSGARSPAGATQANQLPISGRTGQSGSVVATESPVPGITSSVNTINPAIQVQGPYAGSASSTTKMPFSGRLSLREAIERAVQYNLGAVGLTQAVQQARGQTKSARSALLPNLNASLNETIQQLNLRASGFRFSSPLPGFSIPSVVGPFNFFDLRATLSQTVFDLTTLNNYRAARENLRASELSAEDAGDLIVLAVGGAYLQ